jgi:hypothetical protein
MTLKKIATKSARTTTEPKEATAMKKTAAKTVHAHATHDHVNHEENTTMKTAAHATEATATQNMETTPTAKSASASASDSTTTSSSAIAIQLQALEKSCGYGDPLPDAVRSTSEKLVHRVPQTIVDRVLALAVRGGGVVAGITLDPNAAKMALAEADEADAVATAASMLGRRAQDQSVRLRAGVSGKVSAIRTALRGYAKTEQGASLAQENNELTSLAKQHAAAAKARRTRTAAAVTAAKAAVAVASSEGETPVTDAGATSATTPVAAASVAPKTS